MLVETALVDAAGGVAMATRAAATVQLDESAANIKVLDDASRRTAVVVYSVAVLARLWLLADTVTATLANIQSCGRKG